MTQIYSIHVAQLGDKMVAYVKDPTPQDVSQGFGPDSDYQELVVQEIPVINNDGCLDLELT